MIIILEGPDGSGKTTLAKQLTELYKLNYHHEGPPPTGVTALEHYGALLETWRRPDAPNLNGVVFDRLALGERVYGPIWRGRDMLGDDGWRIFKRLIRAACAIEVLCLPSYEVCYANWHLRQQEMITDPTIFKKIYDRYNQLRDGQFIYDYRQPLAPEKLQAWIERRRRHDLPLPPNFIGNPYAQYLFVGDIGSNQGSEIDLPFFSTENSSAYLLRALDKAGYKEHEMAFINAYNHDGTTNQILRFPKVIALGARASLLCQMLGVSYKAIPHPQYWKRFHYHDIDGYVNQLKACR